MPVFGPSAVWFVGAPAVPMLCQFPLGTTPPSVVAAGAPGLIVAATSGFLLRRMRPKSQPAKVSASRPVMAPPIPIPAFIGAVNSSLLAGTAGTLVPGAPPVVVLVGGMDDVVLVVVLDAEVDVVEMEVEVVDVSAYITFGLLVIRVLSSRTTVHTYLSGVDHKTGRLGVFDVGVNLPATTTPDETYKIFRTGSPGGC